MPMLPVVVYPGWFIDFDRAKKQGYTTAVTNDRNLVGFKEANTWRCIAWLDGNLGA